MKQRELIKQVTKLLVDENQVILHEENGQINSYTVDESLFDFISCLNEKKITVKVRGGKIIEVQ